MTRTEKRLSDLGIPVWEKYGKKRFYINKNDYEKVFGLRLDYYNTGNISCAKINGEMISNSSARRLLAPVESCGVFYDCIAKKWSNKNFKELFDTLHFSEIDK